MVLESIMNPLKAEEKPKEMFFVGLLYASVAVFLALWIFKEYSSLVMVFLTVTAAVPIMYNTMRAEEQSLLKSKFSGLIFKQHTRALSFFVWMFLGFVIAYTLWYVFLPSNLVEILFSIQIETIAAINAQLTGNVIDLLATLLKIVGNNLKVLLFCIFFSFFYGAGAIFILTWNASVIGAAMGNFIRTNLAFSAEVLGFTKIWAYLHVFSLGILRYSIHGIPEITAYFMGGLAGGIISVGVIQHDFAEDKFKKIIWDSMDLLVLAIFFILLAGLIEVFITPLLF